MEQQADSKKLVVEALSSQSSDSNHISDTIDILKELPSLAEKKKISLQKVESLYALGYQLYQAQCYREAGDLFRFVCFFESRVPSYWIALGGAYQYSKHHDNALAAFTMASLLDPHNPEPRFYTAHTLIDLQDLKLALQSINIAIELCRNSPDHADLYRRSMALRNAIMLHLKQ